MTTHTNNEAEAQTNHHISTGKPASIKRRFESARQKIIELPRWQTGLLIIGIAVSLSWLISTRLGGLPDFAAIEDVPQMKRSFDAYLRPIVNRQNELILVQRQDVNEWQSKVDNGEALNFWQRRQMHSLAETYEIDWESLGQQQLLDELKRRVDIIPPALALAQAAKESGWGRSRFAVQGNNLFGQWCYEEGCGIVPKNRAAGATHEVADFSSVSDAVFHYLHNLNTHPNYEDLRKRRQKMRAKSDQIDPISLANGLLYYSQRREAYVKEIQSMVRQFQELERTAN